MVPRMTLPSSVRVWKGRGKMRTLARREVFTLECGTPDGEAVLLLHGFPSSSHDFAEIVDDLGSRRVLTLDLPGYGLSEKPIDYSYSLFEQADVVALYLRELGVDRVHVVAHDMGTSIATELCARRERGLLGFEVASLLLMNGSVHIDLAALTPSQRLLRSPLKSAFAKLGTYRIFKLQLGRIVSELREEDYEAMWALLLHRDGKERLPQIISYVEERTRFAERWIGALTRLDLPTQVLWGPEDTVAVFPIAEALAAEIPDAGLERLEGLGHYPQIEDPERTADAIRRWLDRVADSTPS